MTNEAMAPLGPDSGVDRAIDAARQEAIHYLQEHREATLREFLEALTSNYRVELVSSALASLLSSHDVELTSNRRLLLGDRVSARVAS